MINEVNSCSRPYAFQGRKPNRTPAASKTHSTTATKKHCSATTAANSRGLATKQVPHVGVSSFAHVDTGFVEIASLRVSQLLTQAAKPSTHRQTQRQTFGFRRRRDGGNLLWCTDLAIYGSVCRSPSPAVISAGTTRYFTRRVWFYKPLSHVAIGGVLFEPNILLRTGKGGVPTAC